MSKKKQKQQDRIILATLFIAIILFFVVVLKFDPLMAWITGEERNVDDFPREGIVARVNGEDIDADSIHRKHVYYRAQFGENITKEQVLNITINEMLLLAQAEKQGIAADEAFIQARVDEYLASVTERLGEDLDAELASQGLDKEKWLNDITEAYTANNILTQYLEIAVYEPMLEPVEITEEELLAYWEANKDSMTRYEIKRILVCFDGALNCGETISREEAQREIEEIYDQLIAGEAFESFVNPSDPFAGEGGLLPPVDLGTAEEPLRSEVEKLRFPGQFSKPYLDEDGWQIIALESKRDSFEDFRGTIDLQLQIEKQFAARGEQQQARADAVGEHVAGLRELADIEYLI